MRSVDDHVFIIHCMYGKQPSKASSCHSRVDWWGDKREQESTKCYTFAPCVGSFTCPAQTLVQGATNFTSHPNDIQLGFCWWRSVKNLVFSTRGSNLGPPAQQGSILTSTDHPFWHLTSVIALCHNSRNYFSCMLKCSIPWYDNKAMESYLWNKNLFFFG